ncbi:MAG: PspA/IM30 family protein [Gammaproteobacteria bacterium]|jgi:phage shock protein A
MSIFKRLTATFSSRVDHMVSQIENHDAVVEVAIKESRQATARAKVRLARVQRDGELLRSKISQLQSDEALWTNRARDVAHKDQDRALECVRRRKLCQKQLEQYQQAFIKHEALEQKLAQDIHAAERKLTEMSQQRNLMRTRQSAAEALNSICGVDESVALDVAEAFERWEVKVTESELEVGSVDSVDLLEREFLQTEDKKALQAELEELLAEKEVDHD